MDMNLEGLEHDRTRNTGKAPTHAIGSEFLSICVRALLLVALLAVCVISVPSVQATVTVTSATGGTAISADTTGGSYTALTGPTIAESAAGEIGNGTIILNAPANFNFNTGNPVTVAVNKVGGPSGTSIAVSGITVSTTQITITVAAGTEKDQLTWSGIQVRPTVPAQRYYHQDWNIQLYRQFSKLRNADRGRRRRDQTRF